MVEVLDSAPDDLTPVDRLLLIVIAENANDDTREGWPGWELIARRMRWDGHKDGGKNAVSTALARLARRGLELRVPISDNPGVKVYAANGRRTTYRLPAMRRVDNTATHEGWTTLPPKPAEGWQSRGSKGGTPEGRRVDNTATPSPQEPSLNPQHESRSEPAAEEPTRTPLPESLRLIADTLADVGITETEARAIHSLWIAAAKPRGVALFRRVADEGGIAWRSLLEDVRARAKAANAETIANLRRGDPCPHGEPGGDQHHPVTGDALCPHCRRGIPAPDPRAPQPVETYRRLYIAAHGDKPGLDLMEAVAAQRYDLDARGATPQDLDKLAASAAINGHDLVAELRQHKERASA